MLGHYKSLAHALTDLRARGFSKNFGLKKDSIYCFSEKLKLMPGEFEILESYRFEGRTDPYDSAAVYAIESKKYALKGTLVNAYGMFAEELSPELSAKFERSIETV